jgi:putative GTP pyrophosphokinase
MAELTKEQFFQKYNISPDQFDKTKLDFDELLKIKEDFESKEKDYDDVGAGVVRTLLKFQAVHSVRYRIKDSEHLMDKIVRFKLKHPRSTVDLTNYEGKITDLIGIRVLHLFKSNWINVHENLTDSFKMVEPPVANVRKGDPDTIIALYTDNKCATYIHPAGYRSVHYLLETSPTKKKYKVEVQVRTIFEEGWGEIDHTVRYPNNLDNPLLNEFLRILNRLAGSADEMGEFVVGLKSELDQKEEQLLDQRNQIASLKEQIEKSSLAKKEKEKFRSGLDGLLTTNNKMENFGVSASIFGLSADIQEGMSRMSSAASLIYNLGGVSNLVSPDLSKIGNALITDPSKMVTNYTHSLGLISPDLLNIGKTLKDNLDLSKSGISNAIITQTNPSKDSDKDK